MVIRLFFLLVVIVGLGVILLSFLIEPAVFAPFLFSSVSTPKAKYNSIVYTVTGIETADIASGPQSGVNDVKRLTFTDPLVSVRSASRERSGNQIRRRCATNGGATPRSLDNRGAVI